MRSSEPATGHASRWPAWRELDGAECVALFNRTRAKGEAFAEEFGIPKVYDDPEELFQREKVDFVDLCTNPFSLPDFVKLSAASRGAGHQPEADGSLCGHWRGVGQGVRRRRHPLLHPRELALAAPAQAVQVGPRLGRHRHAVPRSHHDVSGYPVFINEPTLNDLENFILTDMGTHILDIVRFYFGEPERLYCQIHQVHPNIKGEDVATVMLLANGGKTTVTCEMGYPENYYEHDVLPQTLVFVEGDKGTTPLGRVGKRDLKKPPPII